MDFRMWEKLAKYRELIAYGVCGVLTTLVNIAVYDFLAHLWGLDYLLSNAVAWIAAFLFAYYANSRYVFGYPPFFARGSLERFSKFFGGRISTGVLDMALMWVLVDWLSVNDFISKVAVNVLVIVLNYVVSKWIVFKE